MWWKKEKKEHFLVPNIFLRIRKIFLAAMRHFPHTKENITVWRCSLYHSLSAHVTKIDRWFWILRGCILWLSRTGTELPDIWSPGLSRMFGCLFMVVGVILLGMGRDRWSTYLVSGYLIHCLINWYSAHVLDNNERGRHHFLSCPSVSIQGPLEQNIRIELPWFIPLRCLT